MIVIVSVFVLKMFQSLSLIMERFADTLTQNNPILPHRVFFMRKFDFDEASANGVSSIVYVISAFASPILGYIVDRLGRNILWVFIAVLVSLGCHALLTFTFLNPFIAMVRKKMAYSYMFLFQSLKKNKVIKPFCFLSRRVC